MQNENCARNMSTELLGHVYDTWCKILSKKMLSYFFICNYFVVHKLQFSNCAGTFSSYVICSESTVALMI